MVTPYEGYVAVCEALAELTPGEHAKKSALFNSGAEAVENAVNLARIYTKRSGVICFEGGYHGRTLLTLALRIPGWCRTAHLRVNGKAVPVKPLTRNGYARIRRTWEAGDRVTLELAMPVERVVARPEARQICGRVALMRGPIVYCLEQTDNGAALNDLRLPRAARLRTAWKPALFGGIPVVQATALRLAELAVEAGLPPGVLQVLPGPGGRIGDALVTHPGIRKVSFTGSTDVGRRIMELASRDLKRVSLELGGKSPNIVFADADWMRAADSSRPWTTPAWWHFPPPWPTSACAPCRWSRRRAATGSPHMAGVRVRG